MKAEIVIKQVRDDMQMMWNKHLLYTETKGAEGIPCLDVPSMKEYMNRTDEEILRDVE